MMLFPSGEEDFVPESELTPEELAEIYRRSEELISGKVKGISLDELTHSIEKRFKN